TSVLYVCHHFVPSNKRIPPHLFPINLVSEKTVFTFSSVYSSFFESGILNLYCLLQINLPRKPIITSSTLVKISNTSTVEAIERIFISASTHRNSFHLVYTFRANRLMGINVTAHIKNNHKFSRLCANGNIPTSKKISATVTGMSIKSLTRK